MGTGQQKLYLTESGELIISTDVAEKYKWWAGGQSIKETLEELEDNNNKIRLVFR